MNNLTVQVCCNVWGQCGITDDFCVDTSVDDTPGTAKNGTYGCISNCGMEIVLSDKKPETFHRIGYFEGWNKDRACCESLVSSSLHRDAEIECKTTNSTKCIWM
jgi:hypothetical protein